MNPLLVILNPRRIPRALEAFDALEVDRAYLTGYTESELVPVIAELIENSEHSHYLAVSDDGIVGQSALAAVLRLLDCGYPVVTGWSNLDCIEAKVNLQRTPLTKPVPDGVATWDLYHWAEVMSYPQEAVPTYFAGMCLTGMSRSLWRRFPFGVYGEPGASSDYHLSWRLQHAGVPIVAAREGFVFHLKERWGWGDIAAEKRLWLEAKEMRLVCA